MSISESKKEKIGSIFNGNQFVIPSYQRKYSWTNKERKEFWDDIKEASKNSMNHFFGTLIFKKITDSTSLSEVYEIIDGQQRTTTLFLLLNELINKLEDGETKEDLLETFIKKRDKIKLLPLGNDENFLKNMISDFNSISFKDIEKRSQKNLYNAKKFFSNLLESYTEEETIKLINFIRNNVEVLVMVVQSQSEAIRMFEIINDRGLALSYLDKIKSILMLYSTMYLDDKLNDTINLSFEKIFDANDEIMNKKDELKILNRFDEDETLFIHHYIKAKSYLSDTWNYRNGAKTIFESIKNKCEKTKLNSQELEKFIREYIEDFSEFSQSYSKLVLSIKNNDKYIEAFQFLEFSATLYPLIVILFQQNKLDKLLDILISVELRVYKFKGTNPRADIPYLCNEIVCEDWTIEEIEEWLEWFRGKFLNDGSFKYSLNENIYGNNAIKYILLKYNNYLNNSNIISFKEFNDLQVEHIFPQGSDKGVTFDITSYGFIDNEDYEYTKDTIGNLTLLEKNLNAGKDVSDLTPDEKVAGYLKSKVIETNLLAGKIDKDGFDKSNIENRTNEIIDFCLENF
ncbi:DUF262 domain-containing protein [Aliarcobacter butzleri]|uniref:DUF262 domain-containing protein n=1 Tax=Aliarcobacter butzleri TaxID=28197 RepID=UPI001EDD6D59|nr:DUF262 domain-containing protein [Aliarcobacter butzleri]MCG3696645.1 DUF262 domain-containing HNH endonuclease family protein [Aliarcobacter butzleri]MCG3699766.1 DUF262 domain-containing HNH endonuclease family protein [Aliarcobacter butzleri]MDN5078945.1 DUF262 domain-containing HNH endonuclease family protein [Aliarcobacter butzleri]MDN5090280.1 DUF262 domain-containing HNH endonuclease family protein [Aliarcobacter butzleri]